jgi:hypothetical protein
MHSRQEPPLPRTSSSLIAGRLFLGLAMLGFALEQAAVRVLKDGLPPWPYWMPHAHLLGLFNALALLLLASALLLNFRVQLMARLGGLYFIAAACLHARHWRPVLFHNGPRTGLLEPLAIGASLLVLAALTSANSSAPSRQAGRILFGLSMIVFGTQHFLALHDIAALVPRWIPFHIFWVDLTGFVFILAGAAIAVQAGERLAGWTLATMFFLWLVLLHLPLCAAQPRSQALWASALVVVALCGGSLVLAAEDDAADTDNAASG